LGAEVFGRPYRNLHAFIPAKPYRRGITSFWSALRGGVLGTFLRERATGESVPAELRDIWSRLLAGDMEADEVAKDLRALVRLQPKQFVSNIVKP